MSDKIKKVEYKDFGGDRSTEVYHTKPDHSPPYVGVTIPPDQHPVTFLGLHGNFSRSGPDPVHLCVAMERHELLELGRFVVRVLDPSPEDKILEALDRIEKELKKRVAW